MLGSFFWLSILRVVTERVGGFFQIIKKYIQQLILMKKVKGTCGSRVIIKLNAL